MHLGRLVAAPCVGRNVAIAPFGRFEASDACRTPPLFSDGILKLRRCFQIVRSNSLASDSLFEIKWLESNAKRLNHHCPMRQTGIVRQYGCLKIGKSGWKTKGRS
ncbi:hypothetical protein CGP77_10585 [Neisseria gonorrhoeae]